MKNKLKAALTLWREDYLFSTISASAISALANIAFTFYNGALGVIHRSIWNGSICVYYLLLAAIRSVVVVSQRNVFKSGTADDTVQQRRVYFLTHFALLLMNISLIVPIAVMVRGQRSYTLGLIPAIAMAAYTTYRVTIAIIHYRKARRTNHLMVSELRTINLVDALVAVLTLQNALIMANGGPSEHMITVTAWTSAGILTIILVITVISFTRLRLKKFPPHEGKNKGK